MRILITGGSGFIGKQVVKALLPENEILIVGRNNNINNLTLNNQLISYWATDYSLESLNKIIFDFSPEAVIHLAGPRPLIKDSSNERYLEYLSATLNLYNACLKNQVSNFVLSSSISVYSNYTPIPYGEDCLTYPNGFYGLSKLWVEDAARRYLTKGLKIKTLRLAQVIGIGEREGYVLQTFLSNAITGKPLKVYGKNIGKRQYVYVKDVAEAIKLSLKKPDIWGAFNIGMVENHSFFEIAETINSVFENPAGIIQLKNEDADENEYLMDVSKARDVLGWVPKFNITDAYKDIKKDLKQLGNE